MVPPEISVEFSNGEGHGYFLNYRKEQNGQKKIVVQREKVKPLKKKRKLSEEHKEKLRGSSGRDEGLFKRKPRV